MLQNARTTFVSMPFDGGKHVSPPCLKFRNSYLQAKGHLPTKLWTAVLVTIIRFAILKRLVPHVCRNFTSGRRSGGPQFKRAHTSLIITQSAFYFGALFRAFRYKSSFAYAALRLSAGFPLQSRARCASFLQYRGTYIYKSFKWRFAFFIPELQSWVCENFCTSASD
jgi:hypothetical protein